MASNYPNMSYCMYQNTYLALDQIQDRISEALDEGESYAEYIYNMSSDEKRKFEALADMCNRFIEMYEELAERNQPLEFDEE